MAGLFQGVFAFLLLLSLFSCSEHKSGSSNGMGNLRLFATDAPLNFENVSSAKITINGILLKESSGELVTVSTKESTLDLLQLRNGLVETLADVSIPAGKYNEITLMISSASIEMKDGTKFPMKAPSGSSSEVSVSVNPDITITNGLSSDVLLDVDLARSFVAKGTSTTLTGFNFKPVVRAQVMAFAGTVSGQVINQTDEGSISGATVTVKKGETVITTAIADSDGFFKVLGLPADTYNITANADSYGSLTIDSVPVTAGNEVTTHFILTPVVALQ